jgi:preprotein translocase subunit SecF
MKIDLTSLKRISFVKHSKKFLILSAVILIAGLVVGIMANGLNLGLDFTGGSQITIDMGGTFDATLVQDALTRAGEHGFTVLKSTQTGSRELTVAQLRLRMRATDEQDREQRAAALLEIHKDYPAAAITGVERVGAVASLTMIKNAVLSVLAASVLILIYVSFRFKFFSALAAILSLVINVVIMIAMVCILRLEVNSSFIAAVLTIIGYSINNTIVIFDRVRDDAKTAPNMPFAELVDRATHETFTRSLYTFLTTLMTIGILYVFGSAAIKEFALPIIIGLLAGAYTSLFIAGPIWVWLDGLGKTKGPAQKRVPKRA